MSRTVSMGRGSRASSRGLRAGEIAMARLVFQDAIDYDAVRIRQGTWWTRGGQAIAPFGHIHFPAACCTADFSLADDVAKVWFIHEMAHVWQYQRGYRVAWAGLLMSLKGGYVAGAPVYRYDPQRDAGRPLCAFNMEQQADLIAHYFDARFLGEAALPSHVRRAALLPFYQAILAGFLADPCDRGCLPATTRVPSRRRDRR